jgi:hypothetical protein
VWDYNLSIHMTVHVVVFDEALVFAMPASRREEWAERLHYIHTAHLGAVLHGLLRFRRYAGAESLLRGLQANTRPQEAAELLGGGKIVESESITATLESTLVPPWGSGLHFRVRNSEGRYEGLQLSRPGRDLATTLWLGVNSKQAAALLCDALGARFLDERRDRARRVTSRIASTQDSARGAWMRTTRRLSTIIRRHPPAE